MNKPVKNRRRRAALGAQGLAPLSTAVPCPSHKPAIRSREPATSQQLSSKTRSTGTCRLVVPVTSHMVPSIIAIFTLDAVWRRLVSPHMPVVIYGFFLFQTIEVDQAGFSYLSAGNTEWPTVPSCSAG